MDKQKQIIGQCEAAIRRLEGTLTASEFSECMDYVIEHNEWLLGLEFAIDWLTQDDRTITQETFEEFERAYTLMGRENDSRLMSLKEQIR